VDEDSTSNCKLLNAASAYFDGGLIKLDRPGYYPYMSTRNNAFGSHSHKAVIIVKAWKLLFIIGGSVAGLVILIVAVLVARWRIAVNADWGIPESSLAKGFVFVTNCNFNAIEKSWCFRHPYTVGLLLGCAILYAVGYWQALDDPDPAPYYPIAKGNGRCLDILCNIIFLPVLRNLSSWLRTTPMGRVLPVDDSLYFHKLIGLLIAFAFSGHITFHYLDFVWHSTSGSGKTVLQQTLLDWTGLTGHVIVLCMTLMMVTGLERFRRRHWGIPFTKFQFSGHSLFVRMHKLWFLVLVLLWTHSTYFWHYSIFPVCLLIIDKLIGRLRGREQVNGHPLRMWPLALL